MERRTPSRPSFRRRPPPGARWDQLELLVSGAGAVQAIQAFDWTRQRWVSLAAGSRRSVFGVRRSESLSPVEGRTPNAECRPLHPPAHFINPFTNGVIVRAK